jgi:SAM-dependent MidA family methyltransferase
VLSIEHRELDRIERLDVQTSITDLRALPTGDPALIESIRARIERDGPVTFAWFMEQALYHPERGYYASGRCAIGRRGDYFTNVSVGPLFGRLMARQFCEMWEALGRPRPFAIVEQGAHDGQFAADVLSEARSQTPELFESIGYCIVEPFSVLRARQAETLREFRQQVSWRESLDALEPFCGVHFSNELVDAMPVHLIRRADAASDWQEHYVGLRGDEFAFMSGPLSSAALRDVVDSLPPLPTPYETEINLAAQSWIARIAEKLIRGYLLCVDYGHRRADYYAPERSSGTLQCYRAHRPVASPLQDVGKIDITAHVEWTSVARCAVNAGLNVIGFTDQHHFLTGLVAEYSKDVSGSDAKTKRALQMLLNPTLLGRAFQFLGLARDCGANAKLSGFKFARDFAVTLGLCSA